MFAIESLGFYYGILTRLCVIYIYITIFLLEHSPLMNQKRSRHQGW